MNLYLKKTAGLTLIEVLVALAIVSIAITAMMKAVSQNVRAVSYLQDKTIATWVGQQIINEARVGLLDIKNSGIDKMNEKTVMLNQTWFWQASEEATTNAHIKKVTVEVFPRDPSTDADQTPLNTLETYVYRE